MLRTSTVVFVLGVTLPAAAQPSTELESERSDRQLAERPLEISLEGHVGLLFDADDEADERVDLDAAGFALDVRWFGAHQHGIYAALRTTFVSEFCILWCDNLDGGVMPAAAFGWAYRGAFAVRENRAFFEVTPHFALQAGRLGGDFDFGFVGGELGVEVSVVTGRGAIFGVGGRYEVLGTTHGHALQGGAFLLRVGVAPRFTE